MKTYVQNYASLFGPVQESFDGAKDWIAKVKSGEITSFIPAHGRDAGYHVEPSEEAVPVQNFDPPFELGDEVRLVSINRIGDISMIRDLKGRLLLFFPHLNAKIEYDDDA